MTKRPLGQILEMLQERPDIYIAWDGADGIRGSQMRRLWEKSIVNPEGFNPVERERWHYYAQMFVIRERKLNRTGELVRTLGDEVAQLGRLGVEVILFDPDAPLDAVIDRLGRVPADFAAYVARAAR